MAIQTRLAVAVTHVAHIVLRLTKRRAGAIETRLTVAGTHVAHIVAVRAVRHTGTIGTRRAIAAAHVTRVKHLAREANGGGATGVRERVFADTVVLKRAAKRCQADFKLLHTGRVDWRNVVASQNHVVVVQRPLQIRLLRGGERRVVDGPAVGARLRQRGIIRVPQEQFTDLRNHSLRRIGIVETIQTETVRAKLVSARKHVVAVVFGRIAKSEIKLTIRHIGTGSTNIDGNGTSFRIQKVWQINTTVVSQDSAGATFIAITVGVTAHTKAIQTNVQSIVGVIVLEAHIFNIPTGLRNAWWNTDIKRISHGLNLIFARSKIFVLGILRLWEIDLDITSESQRKWLSRNTQHRGCNDQ